MMKIQHRYIYESTISNLGSTLEAAYFSFCFSSFRVGVEASSGQWSQKGPWIQKSTYVDVFASEMAIKFEANIQ